MIDLNGSVKVSAGVLLCAFLVLPLFSLAVSTPDRRPGYGYAGRIEAYRASPELKAKMAKFGMTAGRFVRQTVPDFPDKCSYETCAPLTWRGSDL